MNASSSLPIFFGILAVILVIVLVIWAVNVSRSTKHRGIPSPPGPPADTRSETPVKHPGEEEYAGRSDVRPQEVDDSLSRRSSVGNRESNSR